MLRQQQLEKRFLAISFAAGLIYLVKAIDQTKRNKRTFWLEVIMFSLVTVLGFVLVSSIFTAIRLP